MQHIPWEKIKSLQKEIDQLKNLNKKRLDKKNTGKSLYGILKGVKVSEKDFKEAEKALFPHIK